MKALVREVHQLHTPNDVLQAAKHYVLTGNLAEVSRRTNIPLTTLHQWKHNETRLGEWDKAEETLRSEVSDEFRAGVDEMVHSALREAKDRLDNGDYHVDSKGNVKRIPVKAKDAGTLAAIFLDKHLVLSNKPTSITGNQTNQRLTDALEKLAEIGAAEKERIEMHTIDAEVVDN